MWLCLFLRLPHQFRTFWNERPAERIWRAYIWIRSLKEWTHKLRDLPNICFYDSNVLERAEFNNYPPPNGHRQQGWNYYKIDAAFATSALRLLVSSQRPWCHAERNAWRRYLLTRSRVYYRHGEVCSKSSQRVYFYLRKKHQQGRNQAFVMSGSYLFIKNP